MKYKLAERSEKAAIDEAMETVGGAQAPTALVEANAAPPAPTAHAGE